MPTVDFKLLDEQAPATLDFMDNIVGDRMLQGHRLAAGKYEHAKILMDYAKPPYDAEIVDIGCGFGELAQLWSGWRSDLQWWLVNGSEGQLNHIEPHEQMAKLLGFADNLPLANGCCDMAVFTYSLCQMDPFAALAEAARVVKLGGTVFLYEPVATTPYQNMLNQQREKELWAHFDTLPFHLKLAESFGLRCTLAKTFDPVLDKAFAAMLERDKLTHLLDGVVPAVMRFTKEQ